MTATRTLHVVTTRRWVADDLTEAGTDVTIRHSLGLDIPAGLMHGEPLWAPMAWVARALLAGAPLTLVDPGPSWTTRLPEALLGRRVACVPLREVPAAAPVGFFKPANMKVETVPARWGTRENFLAAAAAAGLAEDSLVLWTDTRLTFAEEHRVFVRHCRPVTASPYLIDDVTWHPEMTSAHGPAALAFAASVLAARADDLPPAFTLDVGLLADGGWVVIETNPAWSSAFYGADPAEVVETLLVASTPASGWTWEPDPWLVAAAARHRPLRVDSW